MTSAPEINVLGELEVRRAGALISLPPSRKTRALLAYLVLGGRAYRREQLCDLLWDVADDPRAELRWSLSKLRSILDDDGAARIDAGREEVAFRAHGAVIDLLEVKRALGGRALESIAVDELERLVRMFRGEVLEGLDLPDFDVFQAWCVAQREEARSARLRLLVELVRRLRGEPARAVDFARTRVAIDPHDPEARASLVELLGKIGRRDEARAHYESGMRIAAEDASSRARERLERAWRVVGETAAPAQTQRTPRAQVADAYRSVTDLLPLVGREHELDKLDAVLARVEAKRRFTAVTITGSLGTGKSRLLAAWLPRARGTHAVATATTAFEADAGRPYGPWLDTIARLPEADARPHPVLAQLARATSAPSVDTSGAPQREPLYEEVAAGIAEIAATTTLVIAFDDAHWLDAGAAALLVHVARRCDRLPVLAVLLARPGELEDNMELARALRGLRQLDALVEYELPPLDADATATLVRAVRPSVDPEAVFARSGGNPLFALELARGGESDDGAAPTSVATAIRDRLAGLPEAAAQVLRWGAVMRRELTTSELEQVTGLRAELVVDALDHLVADALLVSTGDVHAFAHELVRQVVYDGLSDPRRRLMHRRIAESLVARLERGDDRVDIADVAHHAAAAHDAALAARACLTAARRSQRVFASSDAAALARRGLRHAEAMSDPDRTCVSLELLEVALGARRPIDGAPVAQQVEQLAERALDLGRYEHARLGYHLLAYLRWEHGAWSDARRHMHHARAISLRGGEPEQIVGLAETARCLVLLEKDLPEAQALALEAAARGRLAGIEPPATFAALGMLYLHQGRLADARTELERALSIARVRRDRFDEYQALEQLAQLAFAAGDVTATNARAHELAELGARFAEGSEAPFARGMVALARLASGDDAHTALDLALDELAVVDAKQRLSYLASRAAWLDVERGELARAAARASRALDAAQRLERATEVALAHGVLVRAGDGAAADHVREIAERWPMIADGVRTLLHELVADELEPAKQPEEVT